jgi:hypothetical protein
MNDVTEALSLAKEIFDHERTIVEMESSVASAKAQLESLKRKFSHLVQSSKGSILAETPKGPKAETSTDKVVAFIYGTNGKEFAANDIYKNVKATPALVRNVIFRMKKKGTLAAVKKGQYKLTAESLF